MCPASSLRSAVKGVALPSIRQISPRLILFAEASITPREHHGIKPGRSKEIGARDFYKFK